MISSSVPWVDEEQQSLIKIDRQLAAVQRGALISRYLRQQVIMSQRVKSRQVGNQLNGMVKPCKGFAENLSYDLQQKSLFMAHARGNLYVVIHISMAIEAV